MAATTRIPKAPAIPPAVHRVRNTVPENQIAAPIKAVADEFG